MNPPTPRQLRYAVLLHTGVPEPHFDLLLETRADGSLKAWRLPVWPVTAPVAITALPDHRRRYLDYEGPISGGRGEVRRVAGGTFTCRSNGDDWAVRLEGGGLRLRRLTGGTWEAAPA